MPDEVVAEDVLLTFFQSSWVDFLIEVVLAGFLFGVFLAVIVWTVGAVIGLFRKMVLRV